ncbi:MAG: protein-glutamate O-methyltransferase CheR [Gammaproteobacteria bacterium]|nr:MAG: protein-glutamate O-methyltransferase CheR [Gammaproteobacteria bacterium]
MNWNYQAAPPITDQEYARWEQMLEHRTGIHFASHRAILRTALLRRMREIGCQDFESYYRQVCGFSAAANAEWTTLINGLTVRETRFFRHPASFGCVRRFLLDRWEIDASRPLQMWSAGCSSGEEVYSLAFIAAECEAYTGKSRDVRVIGSDISETALTEAREAVYPASRISHMTPAQQSRFVEGAGSGKYRVREEFRTNVEFRRGNLGEPIVAPGSCDVVFCQNVLIYFRSPHRETVLNQLVDALRPGGLLITGSGETSGWSSPRLVRLADSQVQAWLRRADNDNDMTGVNHG